MVTVDITKKEAETLFSTLNDFKLYGKTDVKCPRCQKKLDFIVNGSSHIVRCEDDNCIKLIGRGI